MLYYQNENQSGEYDFRCGCHTDWIVEAHIHEYSELIYCTEGKGSVFVNGRQLILSKGQLIWLPPNYVHKFDLRGCTAICAVFSNDYIPLYSLTAGERRLVPRQVDMQELTGLLNRFHTINKTDRLYISGCLNLICSKVLACSEFSSQSSSESVLYQKVISYISTHYTEDITLEDTANRFGYNTKYLSHALHTLTGIHFRELLSQYRVAKAKELLITQRNRSISDIALECGFTAQNTFNRTFKKMTGMTPFAYKNASHHR